MTVTTNEPIIYVVPKAHPEDPSGIERPSEFEWRPSRSELRRALMQLLPPGRAFNTHDTNIDWHDSIIHRFWHIVAGEVEVFEDLALKMMDESFCRFIDSTFNTWLEEYGVPNECDWYGDNLCEKITISGSIDLVTMTSLLNNSGWLVSLRWLIGDDPEFPGVYATLRVLIDPNSPSLIGADEPENLWFGFDTERPIESVFCTLERFTPAHTDIDLTISGLWTPLDLGNKLISWWHGDDSDDGPVSSWLDRISSRAFTEATAANQPVSQIETTSDSRALLFDGVNDRLTCTDLTDFPVDAESGELWIVYLPQNAAPGSLLAQGSGNTNTRRLSIADDKISAEISLDGTLSLFENSHEFGEDWGIAEGRYELDLVSSGLNGRLTSFEVSGNPATSSDRLRVGSSSSPTPDLFVNGYVRHVLIVAGTLTPTERIRLQGYLAHDIGASHILSNDHPYRFMRP